MPHLAPMNWMTAILSIWIITFLTSSLMLFITTPKFCKPVYTIKPLSTSSWAWSLQDGRETNNKL